MFDKHVSPNILTALTFNVGPLGVANFWSPTVAEKDGSAWSIVNGETLTKWDLWSPSSDPATLVVCDGWP